MRPLAGLLATALWLLLSPIAHAQTRCSVPSTQPLYADVDKKLTVGCPAPVSVQKGDAPIATAAAEPRVAYVPAAGDLAAALAKAAAGALDVIELQADAVYAPIVIPVHPGENYVTIRTRATIPERLIVPTDVAATFVTKEHGVPAIAFAPGAHHWRLQWIGATSTVNSGELVSCGDGADPDPTHLPHHITIDRMRIYGDKEQRRGIGANCDDLTVTRSHISNIKEDGADSQAIHGRQGSRIAITESYLEAAGENVMFGGADPSIKDAVPSDITIERNVLSKPLQWKGVWTVKNLLELKNARRVTIRGNRLGPTWASGQSYAIVLTPRNQDGRCPWCIVEDVLIEGNIIRDVSAGFNLLGTDNEKPSQTMTKVLIKGNLIVAHREDGHCFQINGGIDIVIDHNTCISDGDATVTLYGSPIQRWVFTNNVLTHGAYGLIGDASGIGLVAVKLYAPGAVFAHNVFGGGRGQTYPPTTLLPSMADFAKQFVDYAAGQLGLVTASPWKRAGTDGADLGADLSRLQQ